MGLSTGFETKDGKSLIHFRKFYELDDHIQEDCSLLKEATPSIEDGRRKWIDLHKSQFPNENFKLYHDTDDFYEYNVKYRGYYVVPASFFVEMAKQLLPVYRIISRFSDRILDELDNGGEPPEVSTEELSTLKDALYDARLDADNSSFFLLKVKKLYIFSQFYVDSELFGEELIYWRSY